VLGDRYALLRELGSGPHGTSYLARARSGGELVRLKRLRPELFTNHERVAALAEMQRRIAHANVARAEGVERDGGDLVLISAFADGEDLGTLLVSRDLPRELARDVVVQLGLGVAEAHRHGIVHGNLRHENVIVDLSGQVVVTDFGLAPARSGCDVTAGLRADAAAVSRLSMAVLDRAGVTSGALRAIFEHCLVDAETFPSACDLAGAVRNATGGARGEEPWIPRPGEMIGDKYRVLGLLGCGGMGVVVTAEQIDLGRRVAIKLMPPRAARRPAAVERFLREARAASAIENDHVVRVFDVGKNVLGVPYMVMELLEGITLGQMILRRGPLPIQEALDIVLQASVAIAECHARGVVHRDLKPDNLMVLERPGQRGFVKVLDFGVSKTDWLEEVDGPPRLTDTMEMLGTPTYMSPEQVRSSKTVDRRTDIWALGVILYEAISGKPPFLASNVPALSAMIVSDEPARLARFRRDVPPGIEIIVGRCLEKRPDRRPGSVHDLAELLAPFAAPSSQAFIELIRSIASAELPRISSLPPPPSNPYHPRPAPVLAPPIADTAITWGQTPLRSGLPRAFAIGIGSAAFVSMLLLLVWSLLSADEVAPPPSSARAVAVSPPPAAPSPPEAESETETVSEARRGRSDAGAPRRRRTVPRGRGPLDERF
jgi:serine/threonine-protein kinase